eukprot:6575074-Alexandrium_andersonii.AAC.1
MQLRDGAREDRARGMAGQRSPAQGSVGQDKAAARQAQGNATCSASSAGSVLVRLSQHSRATLVGQRRRRDRATPWQRQ